MFANQLSRPIAWHVKRIPEAWQGALQPADVKKAVYRIEEYVDMRLAANATIFPHQPFQALHLTLPTSIKVIILGQDPYHGPEQAQGLAFSVPNHCTCPPSLRNIFKELQKEYPRHALRTTNNLEDWARQGVLLLNALLTVEQGQAGSHQRQGWETITDALFTYALQTPQPKVVMLWGKVAQAKQSLIETLAAQGKIGPTHILTANHPSPLSARRGQQPFMGCNHFRFANQWLQQQNSTPIQWLAN